MRRDTAEGKTHEDQGMTERDLLLAVLALQIGFVDRDGLLKAKDAKTADQERPMIDILRDIGGLSDDQMEVLDEELRCHFRKSGSPLSGIQSEVLSEDEHPGRDSEWQPNGQDEAEYDPQLHGQLDRTPPPPTSFCGVGLPSRTEGRFLILRPHAKGGLGQVSVALDQELGREVAVKEIQPRFAGHEASRLRFLREAEITGGLEHPGIVPVYGLGRYRDGRPYYAMRLIRGRTMDQAIADFHRTRHEANASVGLPGHVGLELRQLLRHLLDVCNAVEYAHGRGVLHRDIKPGNIILGKFGETLLVDWGLARAEGRSTDSEAMGEPPLSPNSDSDSHPTQNGIAIGTPAFMSPEQASGRLDLVGPHSDVYGLGATLFSLLTGQPPFSPAAEDILQRVREGQHPRPREINKGVPAALEAICLKAMALNPSQRYRSARSLANDLERWLADEPVEAWKEPPLRRWGRWCRHHRTTVSTAAVLLMAALVSLSIISVVLSKAHNRVQKESQIAASNFRQARQAVDNLFTKVSEETLFNQPGMQSLRMSLLESALQYYRDFAAQHEDDPSLRVDLGAAYHRVSVATSEIGDQQQAIHACNLAIDVRNKLCRDFPETLDYHRDLARSQHELGNLYIKTGQLHTARQSFQAALQRRQKIVVEPTSTTEDENDLAATIGQIGFVQWYTDPQSALKSHRKAADIRERILSQDPSNPKIQFDLARVLNNIALLQQETGSSRSALDTHERARRLFESLVARDYRTLDVQNDLAKTIANIAEIESSLGDEVESARIYLEASAIWEKLARENPQVTEFHLNLAKLWFHMATASGDDMLPQALEWCRKSRDSLEKLLEASPDLLEARHSLAAVHNGYAQMLVAAGQLEKAAEEFVKGRIILTEIADDEPNNQLAHRSLILLLHEYGTALEEMNRHAEGIAVLHEAMERQNVILDGRQASSQDRLLAYSLYQKLCDALNAAGRHDQACDVAIEQRSLCSGDAEKLYEVARRLARSAELLQRSGSEQDDVRKRQVDYYCQVAVELLDDAVSQGLGNPERIRDDSALTVLHQRRDFIKRFVANRNPDDESQ